MNEEHDLRFLVNAAEQAAGSGDFAAAAGHLRTAVAVQERAVGPGHPDLANTLNNLGVMAERSGQDGVAEAAYRRAYAIAQDALDPSHPFVTTSRTNLREFCEARGLPFEPVAPSPREVELAPPPVREPARAPAARSASPFPALAVGLAVVVAAVLVGWLTIGRSDDRAGDSAPPPGASAANVPGPGRPTGAPAAVGEEPAPAPPRSPDVIAPATPARGAPAATGAKRAGSSPRIEVVRAALCRTLSTRASEQADWPCETAAGTVRPGTMYFYTRLRSPRPASVEHRWYRGAALVQRVELEIAPSPGAGYRTYSRTTIGAERAGEWRVELRNQDNVLLHEQRFTVR
jgi:hypothetical protein